MYQEDEDNSQRVGLWAVGAVTAAVVIGVLGFAVWGNSGRSEPQAVVAAQRVVLTGGDQVVVVGGVVKFYFATGSSNLADGADEALAVILAGAADGKKVVISGFHDSTGNAAVNAEISKSRAMAVRDALIARGIAEHIIEMRKPEVTEGTGDNAEARRVEVVLE